MTGGTTGLLMLSMMKPHAHKNLSPGPEANIERTGVPDFFVRDRVLKYVASIFHLLVTWHINKVAFKYEIKNLLIPLLDQHTLHELNIQRAFYTSQELIVSSGIVKRLK
jgi:hypothetical protein